MSKVGMAIVGCGNIGPVHAAAISQVRGAKLVAVSDIDEARAASLAGKYGAEVYTDYRAMLRRADIQAVSICVPSGLRVDIAEACAAAGKHILSEKPLEINTERIDRIIRAADKAKVLLGCIFQSRFAEGTQQLLKAVQQGRFGKLVLGDAYIKWYRTQEYYAAGKWRGTKKWDGGGALMNQGIHYIDLLLYFMGPVKRVTAQMKCIGHPGLEVEDLATVLLEFKNGAMGVIEGTTSAWPGHSARVEIYGMEGSAALQDGEIVLWKFAKRKAIDAKIEQIMGRESSLGSGAGDPMSGLKTEGHRLQIDDFVRAIQQGRKPRVDGREGRHAVALIESIYRSAKLGKPVTLK
ncbi:MAG TPA: Gfo/Idh/MocA family oxidoreductase [Candidatus Hydrogenedentes bacterium]|nr:Gfo/Idh/MocA family oxidoreductase [Candidatus Hydrogenedentota bacterium]